MNKEYVYLVFYQPHDLPVFHDPIEYRCKHRIDHLCRYAEMKQWIEEKFNKDVIITGFTFLREENY